MKIIQSLQQGLQLPEKAMQIWSILYDPIQFIITVQPMIINIINI